MNLKETLKHGMDALKKAKIELPQLEASVMLCFVLNCDKSYIYTHPEENISSTKLTTFKDLVAERISGKPLQYVLGQQEFMSLNFRVDKSVLIPRGDTEILVETVLEEVKCFNRDDLKILDIGTGSGCIAISLAHYLPHSKVVAVDISCNALETARQNANHLGVADRVNFIYSDIYKNLPKSVFDIIVSNPPYIPTQDINILQTNVKNHEPLIALDGGEDGLSFYRTIIEGAPEYLADGGFIALEMGIGQVDQITDLLRCVFSYSYCVNDLQGIERVAVAKNIS